MNRSAISPQRARPSSTRDPRHFASLFLLSPLPSSLFSSLFFVVSFSLSLSLPLHRVFVPAGREWPVCQIMAYNAVAHDETTSLSSSDSRSLSLRNTDPARSDKQGLDLGSLIRSMTSTSYDVVEADDYDDHRLEHPCPFPPLNTAVAQHSLPDAPLRSPSSDDPVPLSHPIPDLQLLQGAYVGNVERLEQSAERLTSSTTDIASEIRKMDQEQKKRSCSSASNSTNYRNETFSPSIIASTHGSTQSTRQRSVSGGSRLAQVAEPDHEDGPFLDPLPGPLPIIPALPQVYSETTEIFYDQGEGHLAPVQLDRSISAASGDTYQQARTLFTDFDGVHFEPLESETPSRQLSLDQPPLTNNPEPFKEPPTNENMVYYPAPVPRMLNLPPKLSRRPNTEREKRRTRVINSIAAEDKKSAQPEADAHPQQTSDEPKDKRQSTIPPQLRASVFFDPPSTTLDIEVKQDSAVATLDSILDASASAPVSAFTDHPYAGHVGSYVYSKPKRATLTKNAPRQKSERDPQHLTGQPHDVDRAGEEEGLLRPGNGTNGSPGEQNKERAEGSRVGDENSSGEDEEDEGPDYVGPPNTLLAELQLRKQELKQRRRAAVPRPTHGMRHTLLELDEMAQKQSEKRRRRPVTLAWDGRNNAGDDEVPLAMLYPDKSNDEDHDRPVGLMERRHQEEHEPLSARRARLRGEPVPKKRPTTVYTTRAPEPTQEAEESGDEVETLAERLKRLKGQNPAESDFAHDLLAEFDSRVGNTPKEPEVPTENETLAQRRSRLQKESGNSQANAKNPRMRRSMATLPQVRPPHVTAKSSHDVLQRPGMMSQYEHRMSLQQFPVTHRYQAPMASPTIQPNGPGVMYPPSYAYNNMMMGMNGMAYTTPNGCGPNMTRQPIEPAQRDVIDRWRQSIQ